MLTCPKKWLRSAALFLVLSMMLSAVAFALEPTAKDGNYKTGTFHYIHDAGKDLTDRFVFSDSWFTSSAYEENPQLRTVSVIAAMASANSESENEYRNKSKNIKALLSDLGFRDIAVNEYYNIKPTDVSVGCCMGRKTITVGTAACTLLAIIPRSEGYGSEWAGNFAVGESGLHEGFKTARDEVLRFARKYVKDNNITGSLKVWIAGHSRGAAVANLTAGYLVDFPAWLGDLKPEDLYAYTFGTPAGVPKNVAVNDPKNPVNIVTAYEDLNDENATRGGGQVAGTMDTVIDPTAEKYHCIHNYYSAGDFFAKVAPAEWGFTCYGRSTELPEDWATTEELSMRYIAALDPLIFLSPTFGDPKVPFAEKTFSSKDGFGIADVEASQLTAAEFTRNRVNALVTAAVSADGTSSRAGYVHSGYQAVLQKTMAFLFDYSYDSKALTARVGTDPEFTADLVTALLSIYVYYLNGKANALDKAASGNDNVKKLNTQIGYVGLGIILAPDAVKQALGGILGESNFAKGLLDQMLITLSRAVSSWNKATPEEVLPSAAALVKNFFGKYLFTIEDAEAENAVRLLSGLAFGNQSKTLDLPILLDMSRITPALTSGGPLPADAILLNFNTPELNTVATILGNIPMLGREHINAALLCRMRARDSAYTLSSVARQTFIDVPKTAFYTDAVDWAVKNGVTADITGETFGPEEDCTRGQFVTFLWRAAGSPAPVGNAARFTDVEADSVCGKAVAWAVEQGITKGTGDTTFSPDGICKRCQIVALLARFAGVEDTKTDSRFTDVKSTDYFAAAVKWAEDNGVAKGITPTEFGPYKTCTRAQAMTFLYRWMTRA